MSDAVAFDVDGIAAGQGSMKALVSRTTGRAFVKHPAKTLAWRKQIAQEARVAMRGRAAMTGPFAVSLTFTFRRPKSAKRRVHVEVKPDLDKLIRAVFDAVTGIVWWDDAQVVRCEAAKRYDDDARLEFRAQPVAS